MVFEHKLIKLVKERKCLYHTKSRSNKNNLQRLAVWKKISDELRRPVAECKQRWRSLRDRFVREKKKLEQEGNCSAGLERWELYDALEFLVPSVQRRGHTGFYEKVGENYTLVKNCNDVLSPDISASCSFDEINESTQSTSKVLTTEIVNGDKSSVSHGLFFEDTAQKTPVIIKRSSSEELKHSQKSLNDFFGGINTLVTSQLLPETTESHLNFESVPPMTSKKSAVKFKDPNEAFLDLIVGLKTAMNSRLESERDENDLFLECIGKKMKRLSEPAKLRIQAKILADETEELLKE